MIVMLNGPPGIGKTTIAYKLTKKLKRSVVIEVDKVKYFAVDARRQSDAIDIGDQQVKGPCVSFEIVVVGKHP